MRAFQADERCHTTARNCTQSGTPKENCTKLVPTEDNKGTDLTISHRITSKSLANRISLQTTKQQSNKPLT
ncbi:hypothetical protein PGT21_004072 [Puccinia graminis f. sp. tritici]|uniref:Uncharacterized protein n=1 Tax=Puccinia graminis f. sp. tritici TaxID=56615 RepID=A0A5B0PJM0_PUCGR|nr:hypothetical protein PGT21_004072 [Puccinia graminis f. sp. tritici]